MSSSFGLLQVESHNLSQAEKERNACKAEQIYKMIIIFLITSNEVIWLKKNSNFMHGLKIFQEEQKMPLCGSMCFWCCLLS